MSATETNAHDLSTAVPTVDFSGALAGDPQGLEAAARSVDAACVSTGFFVMTGHGVVQELVDDVMATARDFFRLPLAEKQKVAPPGPEHYRGFLGFDTTSLAATLGDDETPPDLCESFNVGRFDDPEARERAYVPGAEATFCPNVWPTTPAALRPLLEHYYDTMESLCFAMLRVFANSLDLPPDWFNDKVRDHTALLLFNWYPGVESPTRPGQFRRGAHTDYGAFTVVAAESIPGLQIHMNGEVVRCRHRARRFRGEPGRPDGPAGRTTGGCPHCTGWLFPTVTTGAAIACRCRTFSNRPTRR